MSRKPLEIVQQLIDNITNADVIRELIAPDAVYVSLNFDHPELKTLLPWTGTTQGPRAVDAIIDTFDRIFQYWNVEELEVTDIFGEREHVAVFGKFTYRSATLGKAATSPFAIHAKVVDEKIIYLQCMEDTYATASTFRVRGSWYVHSDPEGKGFDFGTN
ncbi:nuclear transport factor 2 family protein [Hyphomicrobium sp.]|uniref:nuclear transport factor 2 family protein n=1 Tax=Hyphomicrobium sp. TaxID=82 RepID=UPI002FE1DEA9